MNGDYEELDALYNYTNNLMENFSGIQEQLTNKGGLELAKQLINLNGQWKNHGPSPESRLAKAELGRLMIDNADTLIATFRTVHLND